MISFSYRYLNVIFIIFLPVHTDNSGCSIYYFTRCLSPGLLYFLNSFRILQALLASGVPEMIKSAPVSSPRQATVDSSHGGWT